MEVPRYVTHFAAYLLPITHETYRKQMFEPFKSDTQLKKYNIKALLILLNYLIFCYLDNVWMEYCKLY